MSKIPKHLHNMMTKQDRDARKNRPPYPKTKKVDLKRALTSRDFWLGVYFFVMFQLSVLLLTISALQENGRVMLIASMVVAIGLSIHGLHVAKKRQRVKFNYKPVKIPRLIFSVLLIYAGVYAISLLFIILGIDTPVQENQQALNQLMNQYFLPMAFITSIVAPITEELTFREFLPHAFGPSYVSFFINSIIFTLLHSPSGLVGLAVYGFLSLAFLYLRLKNNNLMNAIYAHMGYNVLTVILSLI